MPRGLHIERHCDERSEEAIPTNHIIQRRASPGYPLQSFCFSSRDHLPRFLSESNLQRIHNSEEQKGFPLLSFRG
jgi:hypothetical protein